MEVTLTLLDQEVKDIINVLGQLPTQSNAWPLMQKLNFQLTSQTPTEDASVKPSPENE